MINLQNSPKIGIRVKLPEISFIAGFGVRVKNFWGLLKPTRHSLVRSLSRTREVSRLITAELVRANQRLEEKLKEQICIEAELRQSNAELRLALEKEQKLNDLKTKLLSMASHEFRTPLTTVMMAADMLETFGSSLTSKQRVNFLSRIKVSTELMTELMNEILQYNRIDSGLETLISKEIDLTCFCSELVDEIRLITDHAHKIIFLVQQETSGAFFNADPLVLRQILNNLLANAIKYSPKGGTVKLSLNLSKAHVTFQVEDQGIGIPEDELNCLFEAFKRGSNVNNIQGTGLGLAIVKKYVELYKGEITVESAVNRGSIFTVTLPLAQCPAEKDRLLKAK